MKIILSVGLLLISFLNLFSQERLIKFKHLTVQDGLSRSWVRCIYQDSIGYLWVGTADGLNKYDGISFKTYRYKSGDPHCINNNNIIVIYEDKKRNIWVGTQAGLNLYNREKDEFTPLSAINNNYVSCIYEYNDGRFLIGSPGGLFLFNPSDLKAIHIHDDINIENILHDRSNNFWLATYYHGLLLLDTTDYSYYQIKPDKKIGLVTNNRIHSLFQDSRGGIWIGTNSDGIRYMTYDKNNPRNAQFINFKSEPGNNKSISNGAIYSITEDEKGYLWIGFENGGLNLLDLNTFPAKKVSFRHLVYNPVDPEGISDNSIYFIYHDRQNTIWVGTYGNGLNYYNALLQKFDHYSHQPGSNATINNNRVNAIYEEDDYLWIGTEGGLNVLDKRKNIFQYFSYDYNNPNSIGSNAVMTIFRDSRDNMWMGLWGGGLNLFNERTITFRHFMFNENDPKSIGSNSMVDIIETRDSSLWIATGRGGLNRYDHKTNTFERYQAGYTYNSISSNWVMDVLESSNGDLWIATTVAVDILYRKTNYFRTFIHNPSDPKSISYNGAIVLFEDSRKNIWIGTSNGLNVFNEKDSSFIHYFKSDGLPDNAIQAIEEDKHCNLWLSTNNGITKFIKGINIPEKPVFVNYNVNDGLQDNEFNARASFKNKEDLIYFGGNNGYNVFDPDKIESNPYVPNIVFTRLLIFNKPISIDSDNSPLVNDISVTKKLKLRRKHSVFTIEFASLNLLAPENNQYAFILEGFEKNWNYVGKQHSATYTNLDPGKYTFRVKASNNDRLWNDQGISLDIVILPAWWQTWIAMLVYLLIIVLAIYYFRKNTIISVNLKNELWREHLEKQKSEELNQLKNQFYTNVSHELRTPLTLIIGPLKQLITDGLLSLQLETIYRNANRLKILVDQILDFSKVENHMMKINQTECDVVSFTKNILRNFSDFAGQKNVSLNFLSNVSVCKVLIDEDKMEKILTNIISNAIKNTPDDGKVTTLLSVNYDNSKLNIKVTDTGWGISPEEIDHIFDRFYTPTNVLLARQGTGIGLNLTLKLIKLLNGALNVSSKPDEGATFIIDLPVKISDVNFNEIEVCLSENNRNLSQLQKPVIDIKSFQHEYTILIIDDNMDICTYIESILNNEFNVIWENNSVEALNHVNKYLPDLIISDVMMPELDGFELCRQVKSDLRFSHIPLILLTAKVGVEDQVTGYDTGADDYILKPFEGEILKARVKNLIRQIEKLRQHFIGRDGVINHKVQANALDIIFMEEILNTLREQYVNPEFNVNLIIEKTGMSRSVFYKKFKALSILSINDLVKNFRLNKAAELLSGGHYTVSQVAYECGFSDPAYFSKVFKEYYKVSPKDYTI
jgi:signal transduction histidine kinase/ligand-binding sensor domain-containing protein/DNA-binding response OmpR family regulator